MWRDYARIANACGWQGLLAKYDIDWALVFQDEQWQLLREELEASKNWEPVYQDSQAVLFQKVGPAEANASECVDTLSDGG